MAFVSGDFMVNLMVVLARKNNSPNHSLLLYSSGFAGNWFFRKDYTTLKNPTHLNIILINNHKDLLVNNDNEIAVYEFDIFNQELVNNNDKLELTSDMGKLIEIKPFGEPGNQKLYVLTTRGTYIYQLTRNPEHLTFTLIGEFLNHLATDSHLVPLYENSFAISKRDSNSVLIYEVAQDNTITLENHITMPEPGEMAFDDGILYISNFPRSLYSYTISYPHLTVSTKPKIIQTGEGPTIVKINKKSF
jgi:hypothetical protein